MALAETRRYERHRGFTINWAAVRSDVGRSAEAMGFALPKPGIRVATLSGGNVQRFAVARELARRPKLLVALYLTKGLDVSTAAAVHEVLVEARNQGAGVLLISQDLQELTRLSERLLVLHRGRVVGEFSPERADPQAIGRLMTGVES